MSTLTEKLVDAGFSPRRADAISTMLGTSGVVSASNVTFTPAGSVAATDVQAAIAEVDSEKAASTVTLTAGDGLTGGGDLSANRSFAVGAGTGISVSADAVALANMAEATIKGRASGAGTGAPADLTASQVRTIVAPGLVLLTSNTVSNAATLDIVLTSYTAYRALKFVLSSFVPVTDDVEFWMRFSTDGGSSYDAAAGNYRYAINGIHDNNSALSFNSTSDTKIGVGGHGTVNLSVSNTAAEGGLHTEVVLHDQTNTGTWSKARINTMYIAAAGNVVEMNGGGARVTAQDTDAVRFLFESGNISSGSWALYGYA